MGLIMEEMKRFNYLTSEIDAAYHDVALKLGLSDSAMQVLYAICNNGESCLLSDICKLSGTSKQTINSALRKLEAEDVVYLQSFNGKQKRVCLTENGKVLVKNTVVRLIEIENAIFGSWTKEDQDMYLALTQRYLASFKEKIKEL
ncbi:MAG: helix-turn-helix domain-containing protein [bacterium]|nr:helix-turn-helix domain-containing protein [bacterium]